METTPRNQRRQSNAPVKQVVQPCPNRTIDLLYLTCQDQGVSGANYHVYSVKSNGKPDGVYDKKGTLDSHGSAHLSGVPDLAQFRFYFEKDPETYVPAILPNKEPDKPRAESMLGGIVEWVVGAIQGDFNKEQTPGQLTINVLFGLIPGVDQALDARDLLAAAKDLGEFYMLPPEQQSGKPDVLGFNHETWLWLQLLITTVGCVPTVGSVVKGFIKGLIIQLKKYEKTASKLTPRQLRECWDHLISILNYFGAKGNAHRWMENELPAKIEKWMDEAANLAAEAFKRIEDECKAVIEIVKKLSNDEAAKMTERSQPYWEILKKAKGLAKEKAKELANWVKQQMPPILGGAHKNEKAAATGLEGMKNPNVRSQTKGISPEKAFAIQMYRQKMGEAIRQVAKKNGVIIEIRRVSDDVIQRLMEGCHPKPSHLKMKTKNILDEMLGASPKAKNGEVVLFKPKLPEDVAMRRKEREELRKQLRETDPNDPKRTELIEKMKKINAQRSAKDDDALYKRYRERQAEYQKYEGEFIRNKSLPEGAGNGLDIKPLKGGVEVDENGVLRNRADGKSFTGDHDIFAIKDKRGKTLDIDRPDQKSTIDKVRKELHEEVDTQHGAQLNMPEEINRHDGKKYREMSKKEKALYEGIAEKHGIDPVNKKPIPRNGDMTPKEKPSDRLKRAKLDREKNDPTDTEPKPQDSATVKNPPTPKKPPVNRRKSNSKPEKVDVYDGSI